ncbi:hypothetical protein GYA28_00850 [Candidatus Roizmanbacteria bacterium]|nr:hypothetical protein [Candidatus Roizmanbacteria bacterium]
MGKNVLNKKLIIIAGPCSVDKDNIDDIGNISEIKITNRFGRRQKAVYGTRIVGLKSRTALNREGKNMGIDFPVFMKNLDLLLSGKSVLGMKQLPSIKMADKVIRATGMLVATEIMSPLVQLPLFERLIPKGKLMIWNPAVNQLGWPVLKMGIYAKRNQWLIGLKNGKWLGDDSVSQTSMEKTWMGLAKYTGLIEPGFDGNLVFIHRGVDVANKGDYRSLPVHHIARRVKQATKCKLFFDPSHTFGPKLRGAIVGAVIEAMRVKIDDDTYLYDGILIESGRSKTDTEQHISVKELAELCCRLSEIRDLVSPEI